MFLLDLAVKSYSPRLAAIGHRGIGVLIRPLLWLLGALILVVRPGLFRRLRQEARDRDGRNDLYPLW